MPKNRPDTAHPGLYLGLMVILAVGGFTGHAQAHRVTVFAWVDGHTVRTQSRFSGGKTVQNGRISVYDSQGKLLLSGNTDSDGEFDFNLPGTTDLRIVLDAGMGHVNEWVLSPENHSSSPGKTNTSRQKTFPPFSNSKTASTKLSKPNPSGSTGLTREEVKAIIDESFDNKLKPMMKLLSDLHDNRPSFTDILSGIGYILGLMGLGAFIHYRKKNKHQASKK
jgi:nickel transport protein